jgi:Protein of unknown function (DUF4007)
LGLQTDCESIFAGHQTFHPRFGWIKKAFDGVQKDQLIFNREDATVLLGVGKNMVEAIKFWGLAFKVIEKVALPGKKKESHTAPTNLGLALFDSAFGFDPYLENPSTLWLLHWQALSGPSTLPVWRIFFNEFAAIEFSSAEFLRFADEQISGTTWKKPVPASIEKDFDCLIRMYSRRPARGRQTIDDLMDSPFKQLGLVIPSPSGPDTHRFALGEKPFLTDEVILYAALDYLLKTDSNSKTITTTRLTSDSGSPGRIFKISEDRINQALENCVQMVQGLEIASPAGATQLVLDDNIHDIAHRTLSNLYRGAKASVKRSRLSVVGFEATNSEYFNQLSFAKGQAS